MVVKASHDVYFTLVDLDINTLWCHLPLNWITMSMCLYRSHHLSFPSHSLQVVSLDADIPLTQVLHFASHLIHWGKAMAIYPLSENNIYITSPLADTKL